MAELTAELQLRAMVAAADDPVLSDSEIATLLAASAVLDVDGLLPSAAGWTPTYNLNFGARDGWRMKMGKIAGRFDFGSDVNRFNRSQFFAHCERMVKQYQKACATSVELPSSGGALLDPVIGNINA